MAIEALRQTALQIVNAVQDRVGVNRTPALDTTKHSRVLTDLLNQVQDELSDAGNWQELYVEVSVRASSSVATYAANPIDDTLMKNIQEVHFGDDIAPMEPRDMEDMRRFRRIRSFGHPRNWGVLGVDDTTGNPLIQVHPAPGSNENNETITIAGYRKPDLLVASADSATELAFPAQILKEGLYAKALLEENGGEPTPQSQVALATFERMKTEHLNRFNADSGTDVYFVPGRSPRG